MIRSILICQIIVVLSCPVRVESQTPLGTEFTYQGQLNASGLPAIAIADFQFSLYDAVSAGNQVGVTQAKDSVALINGAFTLSIDFGAAAFSGNARWIQVSVRSPAGTGNFTTLAPRQPLTAAPHSTYALQTRGISVDDAGRVGIGTTTPGSISTAKLDVAGGDIVVSDSGGYLFKLSGGNGATLGMRPVSGGLALVSGGSPHLTLGSDGNVKIGGGTSDARLSVQSTSSEVPALALLGGGGAASIRIHPDVAIGDTFGAIGFTNAGSPDLYIRNSVPFGRIVFQGNSPNIVRYPATAAEDIRIIRGRIAADGTIESGAGFTVTHVAEGEYVIDYAFPFVDTPAVTATINSFGFSACFIELRANSAGGCAPHVVRRSDGNHVDGHFNFIAIGAR